MTRIRLAAAALFAALPGVAQSSQAAPATVTVNLSSYRFDPSPLVLQADRPVRMTFVNQGGRSHDFTAREFFQASRIVGGKVSDGKVDLKGGQQAVVELVPQRGTYRVHCGKFLHSGFGMKGIIVVQ
ncbi:cupredoxin domain-containing protein [Sphingomonas sp. GCM10030256]|uniref:cupredoxin domain-containing protein n=1 Tax=Sphingomonas sp. GCM10030256 TaxID=3273427 RepID=UPI003615C0A1